MTKSEQNVILNTMTKTKSKFLLSKSTLEQSSVAREYPQIWNNISINLRGHSLILRQHNELVHRVEFFFLLPSNVFNLSTNLHFLPFGVFVFL